MRDRLLFYGLIGTVTGYLVAAWALIGFAAWKAAR